MDTDNAAERAFDINHDPYNHMLNIIFSRWKPFILRAIDFDKEAPSYYSRFLKQLPISQKVLSQNLRELDSDGLVIRNVLNEVPPRVEYMLTDRGKSIIPLLDAVYRWGWEDMTDKKLPIDALGEMWHGYRERNEEKMYQPYKKTYNK